MSHCALFYIHVGGASPFVQLLLFGYNLSHCLGLPKILYRLYVFKEKHMHKYTQHIQTHKHKRDWVIPTKSYYT